MAAPSAGDLSESLPAAQLFVPFSQLSLVALGTGAVVNLSSQQHAVGGLFALCALWTGVNLGLHVSRVDRAAVHSLIGALFVALSGANLLTGGFGLPAHFAIGLAPAAAVMMLGLRAGWPWLAAATLEIGAVGALHAVEYEFAAVPPANVQWLLQMMGAVVTSGATFLLAAVFAIDRSRRTAQLRAALEQARSLDRAKSLFLARISHELRTPMNGVLGMLDSLQSTPLAPGQQETVGMAHSSAERLLGLLNALLDITKLEMAELRIRAVPVEPVGLVEESAGLHEGSARRRDSIWPSTCPRTAPGASSSTPCAPPRSSTTCSTTRSSSRMRARCVCRSNCRTSAPRAV